jgi:integrase/recombinase XerD
VRSQCDHLLVKNGGASHRIAGPASPCSTHAALVATHVSREGLASLPGWRDAITRHMLALSTYVGHAKVADTYWYLEAVPELMTDIAQRCERFVMGEEP